LLRFVQNKLHFTKKAEKISDLLRTEHNSFENHATGETQTREQINALRNSAVTALGLAAEKIEICQKKGNRHGRVQLYCLFFGFLAIFASKILQPYEAKPISAPQEISLQPLKVILSEPAATNQTSTSPKMPQPLKIDPLQNSHS